GGRTGCGEQQGFREYCPGSTQLQIRLDVLGSSFRSSLVGIRKERVVRGHQPALFCLIPRASEVPATPRRFLFVLFIRDHTEVQKTEKTNRRRAAHINLFKGKLNCDVALERIG